MCEPCTPEVLLEAVRGLRLAEPDLGFKPLLAKLQAQQPDLGAATKEVRKALTTLKAENEAAQVAAAPPTAAAAAPPAVDEPCIACVAQGWACSWACSQLEPCTPDALMEAVRGLRVAEPDLGLGPLLTKLRVQQPHVRAALYCPITKEIREALTILTAESKAAEAATAPPLAAGDGSAPLCGICGHCHEQGRRCTICGHVGAYDPERDGGSVPTPPAADEWNPDTLKLHAAYHKMAKNYLKRTEDGGVTQQHQRELSDEQACRAFRTGDEYGTLIDEGLGYGSKEDWFKAAEAFREAIALEPDEPTAYYKLGVVLSISGHNVEAAQRFLEAKARFLVGSELWAKATARAFDKLRLEQCAEAAKPEWWDDEGLKALSARVVRAAPNEEGANHMRAMVLRGQCDAWKAGPRTVLTLEEAATYYERSAALSDSPALKADSLDFARWCRSPGLEVGHLWSISEEAM